MTIIARNMGRLLLAAFSSVLCWGTLHAAIATAGELPNVVLIMTDNHGPWTLGCYGNREIRTPNIDRLASEGVRFSRCFSSNAVCSPTRATYLTGLLPSQHGVHRYLGGEQAQMGAKAYNTIGEFRTLPDILTEQGYVCGLTGKWHLGDNAKPAEGFIYWITMPHGHTTTFYNAEIIEDGELRKEPKYLTEFWTDHAVRFLQENKSRRFFLYLPYNGPYGLAGTHSHPARNRHAEYYADKPLDCFPRNEVHPWLRQMREYVNNLGPMRRYAAEVGGVDDGVGRVMDTIEELGLCGNTLVIFTADQGLCGGHHGMWGMGDHSRPLHTYDETAHVPLIYRWPGEIPEGKTSDMMVSNYDFYPSVLNLLGLEDEIPQSPEQPGRDYSPVIRGQSIDWEDVIYYEFENSRMIRTNAWKHTFRFPDGPDELYNLAVDPGEANNLAGKPDFADVQSELRTRLDIFFDRYADPKYDLLHGGGSKTRLPGQPDKKPLRPETVDR